MQISTLRRFAAFLLVLPGAHASPGTVHVSYYSEAKKQKDRNKEDLFLDPRVCHVVSFRGPADLIDFYRKDKASRLEKADDAVVTQLERTVMVEAHLGYPADVQGRACRMNSGVPKQILFSEVGGTEPLLVVELERVEHRKGNAFGAAWSEFTGSVMVPAERLFALKGKAIEFRLVYESGFAFKRTWKPEYITTIFGPASPDPLENLRNKR